MYKCRCTIMVPLGRVTRVVMTLKYTIKVGHTDYRSAQKHTCNYADEKQTLLFSFRFKI